MLPQRVSTSTGQWPYLGPTTEPRRTVGRFRESPQAKALRAVLGTLGRLAPAFAARVGYRLLSTPPYAKERPWQEQLRDTATASRRVEIGDGSVAVFEWGALTRPTILMVHGWGGRATHLGRMIEPLVARGFRVVAFDAPAHGHSSGKRTDLIAYAAAIHAVAQASGRLHAIIAHSFGAAMALLAMRDWGTDTQRLVLISAFEHCRWFCDAFGRYAGLSPAVVDRMRQMLVERHGGRVDWNRMSVAEMLRTTNRPTLLVHDEDDGEIPFSHSIALLQSAPNATMHVTRGFGHHRLLGQATVIDRIGAFIGEDAMHAQNGVSTRTSEPPELHFDANLCMEPTCTPTI